MDHLLKTNKEYKKQNKKTKKTGDSRHFHLNKLEKAGFQHVMAHGCFKNFPRRTAADKVLRNKTFNIAESLNMMDSNLDLLH